MKAKKILVPTDFSEEANHALDVAVQIARLSEGNITLLHVLDVPVVGRVDALNILSQPSTSDDPQVYSLYMHKLLEVTRQRFADLKEKYADVKITEHVVADTLERRLADFVVKEQNDLIVMGSKGVSGIDEILVGSNTEKIIRLAKVPVLTVKVSEKGFKPSDIVFASNFVNVSEKVAHALISLQKLFNAKMHFVKVVTPNTFETTTDTFKLIRSFAESNKFENYTVNSFNYYSEEEGIREFAEGIDAGLITLTTHGRTGIAHLLMGSIAEEVANHSVLPVLTFNKYYV